MHRPLFMALLVISAPDLAFGQMSSGPGAMVIDSATVLRIDAPVNWTLDPGTSLVNNGIILLGPEATITEQTGAPISGDGVERIALTFAGPLVGEEPGGLGLALTTSTSPDSLMVVRGHRSYTDTSGTMSIARWFDVRSTMPVTGASLALHYDTTELNGASEADLALGRASAGDSLWTSYPTLSDLNMHVATAPMVDSLGLFTLFPFTLSTGSPAHPEALAWHLGPIPAHENIFVLGPSGATLTHAVLVDAHGRIVRSLGRIISGTAIELAGLAPGAYMLQADRTTVPFLVR
ncbi:MAG: hypothetical protein H6595_02625 [Flavobacteriales bacterium]|nr:hypothetical protein [Flavobacteriales bacterium]MCB9166353.1 hypothetical protein [Flavobacteriales bacterium]